MSPPLAFAWIERFTLTTRLVHWSLAALVLILVATGAILYVDSLAAAVGRRRVVRDVHLLAGLGVPLVVVAPALVPGSRRFRHDLRQLDTWRRGEWKGHRRSNAPSAAKFGPAQRLFAAFVGGSLGVLVLSGAVLHWFRLFPLDWRRGATAVHDLAALATTVAAASHIVLALAHPGALRGMVTGWVRAGWARRRHPGWFEWVSAAHARTTAAAASPAERGQSGQPYASSGS